MADETGQKLLCREVEALTHSSTCHAPWEANPGASHPQTAGIPGCQGQRGVSNSMGNPDRSMSLCDALGASVSPLWYGRDSCLLAASRVEV